MKKFLNSAKKLRERNASSTPQPVSSFATNPFYNYGKKVEGEITNAEVSEIEEEIKKYERKKDVEKFTSILLFEMENVTEEDILRAVELEKKISIDDDIAVQKLLKSEGLLEDVFGEDFPL